MSSGYYTIYIVRCRDGTLYTGITTNVQRRLQEHATGRRGAKYARGRGPLELVFEQPARDRAAASRIERCIKQLDRSEKEALIAGAKSLRDIVAVHNDGQTSGGVGE